MPEHKNRGLSAVTTGTFDGVHRGHVRVLESLRELAAARGLRPVVVTFDRHPLAVIDPRRAPRILTLPEERDRRLRDMDVEVVEIPFDQQMRSLSARQWVERLRDNLQARALMLGYDNTFGCDGAGMDLCDYARVMQDADVEMLKAPMLPGVSSSQIRKALMAGDIDKANEMLGYRWSLAGLVVHGRGMGRNIGFRTANVSVDPRLQLPAAGVYATTVTLPDGSSRPAVTNIGVRPTFDDAGALSVETHIPGFDGDIYGKKIILTPVRRIRGEQRFETIRDLRDRIGRDVDECLGITQIR